VSDQEQKVKPTLAVWAVFSAGLLAIPVGLIGFRWLDRINTERVGFSEHVRAPGVTVHRTCAERALIEHFGRRQVRIFDDAMVVQIPALQYVRTPEKVHVVIRGVEGSRDRSEFLVETAFYKERPVAARYDEIISGAMSELVDTIVRGCAPNASETVLAGWSAHCTRGPGFTRACPTLRPGLVQPTDTRTPVVRD
jgi:hypothetical protein